MNTSPAPPMGALTSQSLSIGSKIVDADFAPAVSTMTPLGTATWYCDPPVEKSIIPCSTWIVTEPVLDKPLA